MKRRAQTASLQNQRVIEINLHHKLKRNMSHDKNFEKAVLNGKKAWNFFKIKEKRLEEQSLRMKEKSENRLNNLKAAQLDISHRVAEKHEALARKHQLAQSNVNLTRDILSEYRNLKKEEASLRNTEIRANIEINRRRAVEEKRQLLTRQKVKTGNIHRFREKQRELQRV